MDAAGQNATEREPELHITANTDSVVLIADVISPAHLRLLERALALDEPSRPVSVEPRFDDSLSVDWMLASELTTRAAAFLETGHVDAGADYIRIRGTTAWPDEQAGIVSRLRAVARPSVMIDYEVVPVSARRLTLGELCRRQFLHLTSGKRLDFGSAGASLGSASLRILDGLAELMAECPGLKVQVTGHTDLAGGAEINSQVSQARADAVVDYLIGRGLDSGRFAAVGAGSSDPLVIAEDGRASRINRRVEFSLL